MKLLSTLAVLVLTGLGAPAARAADKCGAHQHESTEANDDEGGTVKRCVCDEGWNAGGPGAPCKKVKAESGKKPKK